MSTGEIPGHLMAPLFSALASAVAASSHPAAAALAGRLTDLVKPIISAPGPLFIDPRRLPVIRLLPAALAYAAGSPVATAAALFERLEPFLHWQQNPNYRDELFGPGYMDSYGYANVIGGQGLIDSTSAAAGFGLWGSGYDYPVHHHPAEELYLLLGAPTTYYTERDWWREVPTGGVVHCRPWEQHAMRFEKGPALMFYAWWGEVSTAATLVEI